MAKPFFVLAPMDDVTDVVFREVIASCAAPDLFVTEFVNVDGLQSRGRDRLLHKLSRRPAETNLIAQIWGRVPANYEKTVGELVDMGFAGVDINMGCPDKSVVKNGCCSALANNRDLAVEIIQATKRGVAGRVPVSVKLRTGFSQVDFSWPELVLRQHLDMLTVHGRTTKEMSKVPARWQDIQTVREIRDRIAPHTRIVGNGDVQSRHHGLELAAQTGVDGIMIGRAIFHDPYMFAQSSPWPTLSTVQRLELYATHMQLFFDTYAPKTASGPDLLAERGWVRNWESLKRMAKIYVHSMDSASEFRDQLMRSKTPVAMQTVLHDRIAFLRSH